MNFVIVSAILLLSGFAHAQSMIYEVNDLKKNSFEFVRTTNHKTFEMLKSSKSDLIVLKAQTAKWAVYTYPPQQFFEKSTQGEKFLGSHNWCWEAQADSHDRYIKAMTCNSKTQSCNVAFGDAFAYKKVANLPAVVLNGQIRIKSTNLVKAIKSTFPSSHEEFRESFGFQYYRYWISDLVCSAKAKSVLECKFTFSKDESRASLASAERCQP